MRFLIVTFGVSLGFTSVAVALPFAAIHPSESGMTLIHGCHRSYGQDVTGWHRHDKSCWKLRGVVERKKRTREKAKKGRCVRDMMQS